MRANRFTSRKFASKCGLAVVALLLYAGRPDSGRAEEPKGAAPKPSSDSKKPAEDPAWKSLFDGKTLKGWKEAEFYGHSKVEVKNGEIVMHQGSQMTGITWTGEYPKMDYEIEVDAQRVEGGDFFYGLTFPYGDSPVSLILGGWGGGVVGLSSIGGSDASENETSQYMEFKNGKWYHVRLRVTKPKIEAWVDSKKIIDLPTEDRTFSIRIEVTLSKPLGFSCYETTAALRNIRMRKLGPEDSKAGSKSEK